MQQKPDVCPICGNPISIDSYLFYDENINIYLTNILENKIESILNEYYEIIYKSIEAKRKCAKKRG